MTKSVLAIDDDETNLLLLEEYLGDEDILLTCVPSADQGLEHLQSGRTCDAILLDRMMPGMDGIAFMTALHGTPEWKRVPVIMQTAAASTEQVAEGIAAGVFYYLTKPFKKEALLPILRRALRDTDVLAALELRIDQLRGALDCMNEGHFRLRTLDDVTNIAGALASQYPDPAGAALGLREVLLNAVEHGNLGITYEDKSALLAAGDWEAEVARRLALPEQADRYAMVRFRATAASIEVMIEDRGCGFDWNRYLAMDPRRAFDSHGRGIAMAGLIGFDSIVYEGPGNRVTCTRSRTGKS